MVRKGLIAVSVCSIALSAIAQSAATIVAEGDLKKVVPESYLFRGMSATTQLRNSSAVDYPDDFYVMAGLVDTSGYSSDLRAKYNGFFSTEKTVKFGGSTLQGWRVRNR